MEIIRFPFCRYDASNDKYQPPPGVEIRVNMTLDSMCNETESASVRSLQTPCGRSDRLRRTAPVFDLFRANPRRHSAGVPRRDLAAPAQISAYKCTCGLLERLGWRRHVDFQAAAYDWRMGPKTWTLPGGYFSPGR